MISDDVGSTAPGHRISMFIEGIDLPPPPRQKRSVGPPAPVIAAADGEQALVVGSEIVSFVAGVDPHLREAIVNCSLIAQLAANRQVPDREQVQTWHAAYFDILINMGWVIEERGFSEHRETSEHFETHTAILGVAATLLGPTSAGFALVKSTIDSLKAMSEGPWLTIFRRESQAAKAAKFQLLVAETGARGFPQIKLMAFEFEAKSVMTQVLFAKFRTSDVSLRHASGAMMIDNKLLCEIAPTIAKRVGAFQRSFIDSLPI